MANASPKHRPDIDGLRALAVLPVVAYHVGVHSVPGGFIGVDVFFVISGYLITQVLVQDIHENRFSLIRFYERRVRRILPALLALLAATFFVCLKYSLPSEFVGFSKSLVAAALSVSNVYFWETGGYFAAPALTKPLLHTWSLAVEEQFYIFWPLFLWVGLRLFRRRLLPGVVALLAVSLCVGAIGAFIYPSATFYLVHGRAWELLLGALPPLGAFATPLGAPARNLMSITGLLLIVVSALAIHSDMPFPGLLALPPCLGTLLVLLAGRDGDYLAARLLSFRPVAFIGIISYSLYLWHWPLTVFQRNYALLLSGGSEREQKLVIIAWSLALAALSWKFVEQPFREGRWRPGRTTLFRLAGAGTTAVVILGAIAWGGRGFPARYSAHELQIAGYLTYDAGELLRSQECFVSDYAQKALAPQCLRVDNSRRNYLLLGDSHAAQLWIGLSTVFGDINFLQATAADCLPLLNHGMGEMSYCTRTIDDALYKFLPAHRIDRVLLAARWKAGSVPDIGATLEWFRLRRIPVTLIGPTVVYDSPLPRLLLTAERTKRPGLIGEHWDHSLLQLDGQLAATAAEHGAAYISMLAILCPDSNCRTADANGMPLFHDREHFTAPGSVMFAQMLKTQGLLTQPAARASP